MRRVYVTLFAKVIGNLNADGSVGTRILIKKMEDSKGNVYPYISSRSIKYGIREALFERGFMIDPLLPLKKRRKEGEQAIDSGDPVKYVDNDLFGFLKIKGEQKGIPRHSPIMISYMLATENTPITVEFAGRFPRKSSKEEFDPAPFEIEVAHFIGKLDVVIEERVGIFSEKEIEDINKENLKELGKDEIERIFGEKFAEIFKGKMYKLPDEERKKRIKKFMDILLSASWKHARAGQHGMGIFPIAAVIILSEKFFPYYSLIERVEDIEGIEKRVENIDKEAVVEIIKHKEEEKLSEKIEEIAKKVSDYLVR